MHRHLSSFHGGRDKNCTYARRTVSSDTEHHFDTGRRDHRLSSKVVAILTLIAILITVLVCTTVHLRKRHNISFISIVKRNRYPDTETAQTHVPTNRSHASGKSFVQRHLADLRSWKKPVSLSDTQHSTATNGMIEVDLASPPATLPKHNRLSKEQFLELKKNRPEWKVPVTKIGPDGKWFAVGEHLGGGEVKMYDDDAAVQQARGQAAGHKV